MIVSQAQLDLVLNRAIRSRVIHLPVRYGRFGERKRCPAHKGCMRRLRIGPAERYRQLRAEASKQPTRAQAVLALLDLWQRPVPSYPITVIDQPEMQGDVWIVRFIRGDHAETLNPARLLSAKPGMQKSDYTSVPSRALSWAGQEVSSRRHDQYAAEAMTNHADVLADKRRRLLEAIGEIQEHATNSTDRKRLKTAAHYIRGFGTMPNQASSNGAGTALDGVGLNESSGSVS